MENTKNIRKPNFLLATIPIVLVIITALMSVLVWGISMQLTLIVGIVATSILGLVLGHKWADLDRYMNDGVYQGLTAVFIMLSVGIIIATWIQGGVIPAIIYYSLQIIDPSIFIPIVAVATAIFSVALGSSFTTIATLGVAFMVVGISMGFPPALVAGAVISGSYFGDKLSPLSDTTVMTPAFTDTDLMSHVKHMLWDTIPALFISLIIYYFIGHKYSVGSTNLESINEILNTIDSSFALSPLLLLLPVLTIVIIAMRFPVLPTILFVGVLGGVVALLFQGSSFTEVIHTLMNGYQSETGVENVDAMLSKGGLFSMFEVSILVVLSTGLGGVMDKVGVFDAILYPILKKIHKAGTLIAFTVVSTLGLGFASGAQHLQIVLAGRGFTKTYKERGLDTKNLSRAVEAGGTVGINLVPWSVNAIFALSVLEVNMLDYIPFSYFIILVPIINILYGLFGITIAKKDYPETIKPMGDGTKETSA